MPHEVMEDRMAKHSEPQRSKIPPPASIAVPESLAYAACHDLCPGRVLLQERRKSLRPAVEILRSDERNYYSEDLFRCRRHHRSFRITGGTTMWPSGVGEQWQSFQIQFVLADALVRLARESCAKHNFPGHMRQVVQANRQAALHRHEIDYIHHGVDLPQAFSRHHPAQQRFRPTAASRRIFSHRLVLTACGH